ncbi:MAG TPA: Gfo/Idh/MocA family oxidoreductase [Armatimonadota bacterium]|jgi:predicted dehydrogenase
MKRTLAIFGAGGWGWNWTERSLRDPGFDTLAYVDSNPATLDRIADRGVPRDRLFLDAQTALDATRTDAVTVTIPNPARVPILFRALEEGRHILVDKPLVHTTGDLSALLQKAAARRSVFMVAQNYRFFLGLVIARQWLEGGRFGPPGGIHVRFLRRSPMGGKGFLSALEGAAPLGLEMLIHQFDLLRFLLRSEPLTVKADGWRNAWSRGAGCDALDIHMEFPDGVHVALDADWSYSTDATDWPGDWDISLRDGSISLGNPGRSWRAFDASGSVVAADAGPDTESDTAQSLDRVWHEFKKAVDGVESGEQPPREGFCPLEDNSKSLAIALAVSASVESGETVDYPVFVRANRISVR